MKRLIVGAALMALAGCSSLSETNEQMDTKTMAAMPDGSSISAQDLRLKFRARTGSDLVDPTGLQSCWNATCRFEKIKDAYNSQLSEYIAKEERAKEEKAEAQREEAMRACMAKPSCRKEKERFELTQELQQAYETTVMSFSRSYAEGDSFFRQMCGRSAAAQHRGMSRVELMHRLEDAPGVSPYYRQLLVESAGVCWDSAKIGVNWREAIRIPQR